MCWLRPAGFPAWLSTGMIVAMLMLGLVTVSPAAAQAPPHSPPTAPSSAYAPNVTPTPLSSPTPPGSPTPAALPTPSPGPGSAGSPWTWLTDPLGTILGQVTGWVRSAITTLLTAAIRPFIDDVAARWERVSSRFNYMTTTPAAMTYEWSVVVTARERMRGVANAALGLLAVLAAYNVFRPHLGLSSEPPLTALTRLALAALAANTTDWWTGLLIELNNEVIRLYTPVALTNLFTSDHLLGWLSMRVLAAPLFLLFAIVTIIAFCALVMQLWGRLILLNVLLVLAPLATVLAATPLTSSWAARWRDQFLAATFSQALSLLALALATQLAAPIFMAGQPGMSALAALGGLWLAYQAPRWLRDHAVPAVVGLAGTVSPLAAATSISVLRRRIHYLTASRYRPDRTSAQPGPKAPPDWQTNHLLVTRRDAAASSDSDGHSQEGRPVRAVTRPDGAVISLVEPRTGQPGTPVAWDERQQCWMMPAALPRSGAPVQPLPHLGVAVVLPRDQPYVLQPEDGTGWLADPAALPADRRRVTLGRDQAGRPVALVAPDPARAVWDSARRQFMAPRAAPAEVTALTYVGDGPEPHFLARPTDEAVRAAGGQPETLVWDGTRRAWLAAPLVAGWVVWQPATRTFVHRHSDAHATLHPAGGHWVIPPQEVGGRAAYVPATTIAPVPVPTTAYPARPVAPQVVPLTRQPLETVPLMPVPEASLQPVPVVPAHRAGDGLPARPAPPPSPPAAPVTTARAPVAFPGPSRRT